MPGTVKAASAFLIASALWIPGVAVIQSGRFVPFFLIPGALMSLISFGLLRRRRWAWWSAMVFASLWLTGGLLLLTGLVSETSEDRRMFVIRLAAIPVMLLASAIGLLVRADSRALFRRS
jgi:hypothetical protein